MTIISSLLFAFTPYGIPLAIASAWYHHSESDMALRMDYVGIAFLGLYFFSEVVGINFWWIAPFSIIGYFKVDWLIALVILTTVIATGAWLSLGLFITALLCRIYAKKEGVSYDLFHSCWHLLSATGFYLLA